MSGVVHGGVTPAELARAAELGIELVDLSASLNPYGPHPEVIRASQGAVLSRYPEADAHSLRAAYADRHGVPDECVLAGNGSTELLYLLARVAHGAALILGPTFGEYEAACRAAGIEMCTLRPSAGLSHSLGDAIGAVREQRPGLVFVCNPNNPTGQLWPAAELRALAAALAAWGGWLLVDEAYMDFAYPCEERTTAGANALVLRSMTKLHAIPGLRLGFLVGDAAIIRDVGAQQPSWSVSAPASAAAMVALTLGAWENECRAQVAATRARLADALGPIVAGEGRANFLLLDVGDADAFRARLFACGWVVRDCTSFGLPGQVRVAVPKEEHVERLICDIQECLP